MPPPHPLRARYIGYLKTQNHGDEVLIWIIRELMAPEIIVETDCNKYDIAILGGGTLINQSPWIAELFSAALDKAGSGIVLGSGVGDLAFWGNHFDRWTPLLNRCSHVGVRGPHSTRMLNEQNIERVECVGDPYLWLQSPVKRDPIEKRIGINIGSTNNSLWGSNDTDVASFVTDIASRLIEKGWSVIWFSVCEHDLFLFEVPSRKLPSSHSSFVDVRRSPLEALAIMSSCEVFIGEKLHSIAMAAVAGVPFIALEYQPKVSDFADSLGMDEWVVSTAELDTDAFMARVDLLSQERASVALQLVDRRQTLRLKLLDFVRRIKLDYGFQSAKATTYTDRQWADAQ